MEMNRQANMAIDQRPGADHAVAVDAALLRANTYSLLAALLSGPPNEPLRQRLLSIELPLEQNGGGIAGAWPLLRLATEHSNVSALDDEYHALFIGVGCGELVPYGSWYLTGFMMDKPLALLRQELRALGFERPPGVTEPEDHAATLCEVMAELIRSGDENESTQRHFFSEHLAPWLGEFFEDLQQAESAVFYRAVGRLGREFVSLERRYLSMRV